MEIARELRVANMLGRVGDAVHKPVSHGSARRRPLAEWRVALLIEGDDGTSLGRREIAAAFHHADFNRAS